MDNSTSTSSSTPISNSTSTSTSSTQGIGEKSVSTPQNKPTTQNVGGDQKTETNKTEVIKESKEISAH